MSTVVVEFVAEEHLEEVIDVLFEVRNSDPTYPPPVDAGCERDSFAQWLLDGQSLGRWVAVDRGRVLGYIQVVKPHRYLTDIAPSGSFDGWGYASLGEIGKFFVRPESQRSGNGRLLFDTAIAFTRASKLVAVLAVVVTSKKAIKFYQRQGMEFVTAFSGVHGENHVYVDSEGRELP